jgi:hypothetical protein
MERYALSLLMVAHGLVYVLYYVPNKDPIWPFTFEKGILSRFTRLELFVKITLLFAVASFILSGVIVLVSPNSIPLWHATLFIAAVLASLIQFGYWQSQLLFGLIINGFFIYLICSNYQIV